MNQITLIGHMGKDPELKMTPAGQALARFSLATTETWKNQSGEKQSKTEWHHITCWGKQAEVAEKFLRKGQQLMVQGKVQYREYTDQQGVKRTATDIRCDTFEMLGKRDGARDPGPDTDPLDRGAEAGPAGAPSGGQSQGGYEDDIPF